MSDRPPSGASKDIAVRKGVVVGKAGRRDLLGDLYAPAAAGEGHAFDRKTAEGGPRMVSVADPRSVYGGAVVGLITLFFRKYLARGGAAGVARKEARCLSLA